MNPVDKSINLFNQGFSCSQSVLLAFSEQLNVNTELSAKLSAGFGGGMGRTGHTCGAATGALMVIGLFQGSSDPSDKVAKEKIYEMVRNFIEIFIQKNGKLDCPGLLGVDISTPQGLAQAREEGRFKNCSKFVQEATLILTDLLQNG